MWDSASLLYSFVWRNGVFVKEASEHSLFWNHPAFFKSDLSF